MNLTSSLAATAALLIAVSAMFLFIIFHRKVKHSEEDFLACDIHVHDEAPPEPYPSEVTADASAAIVSADAASCASAPGCPDIMPCRSDVMPDLPDELSCQTDGIPCHEFVGTCSPEGLRDLYDRMETLFDSDMPYLDSDLSISDVSQKLYTNKSYVSRALSTFAGKNFCQYVNAHRIQYSIMLFEEDASLKVTNLAHLSGFHSTGSYTIAFKALMKESPGEWCRKRRREKSME